MIKKICLLTVFAVLALAAVTPASIQATPAAEPTVEEQNIAAAEVLKELEVSEKALRVDEIKAINDLGPAPWTSFGFEHSEQAMKAWVEVAKQLPPEALAPGKPQARRSDITEREEAGEVGRNDSPEQAQQLDGFGTQTGQNRAADISGNLSGGQDRLPIDFECLSEEDDGSIDQATEVAPTGAAILCGGVIGDGPYGESSGDVDFYALGEIEAGSTLTFDVQHVSDPFNPADTILGIYDAEGTLLTSTEDDGLDVTATGVELPIATTGVYYGVVAGCCKLPADPFDSASGAGEAETGTYELFVLVDFPPCISTEDDGSISQATDASRGAAGDEFTIESCTGEIGNGPFGESSGDTDFFETQEIQAGTTLIVGLDDDGDVAISDVVLGVYDSEGALIASNQDEPDPEFFFVDIETAGEYYVAIGGGLPADPTDSSSGTDTTITGDYTMLIVELPLPPVEVGDEQPIEGDVAEAEQVKEATSNNSEADLDEMVEELGLQPADVDFYKADLQKGDVISGGFDNARTAGIISPDGTTVMTSSVNPSFIYPEDSPLRHERRNGFDHVVAESGTHFVYVTDGLRTYEGELNIARSGLADSQNQKQQIIFVDFDGASVVPAIFGTGSGDGEVTLSPMADFITKWGLELEDEDAIIDSTIDSIIENLDEDLRIGDGRNSDRDRTGQGTEFDVKILNSRDHEDPWGKPNVSRLIIGGTQEELTIPTIGIAQSIDPGNTDTTETAVILLDILSDEPDISFGQFEVAADSSRVELVGHGIGHVASHEAGHYLGSYHTELFDDEPSLMDPGGDFDSILGIGADQIFGTDDDIDADFVAGPFFSFEGFEGEEDTAARTVFALSTGNQNSQRSDSVVE